MRVVDVTAEELRAERDALLARRLRRDVQEILVPIAKKVVKDYAPALRALATENESLLEERAAADPSPSPRPTKKWNTRLVHPTYQIVGDECPNCDFPEAEGGYCPECGWSLPHPLAKRR